MDENDEMTDPAVIGGVMFFYAVAGVGLLGGWKHWSTGVRALFCLVFPLHAIVTSLWSDVHAKLGSQVWPLVWAVVIVILILVL